MPLPQSMSIGIYTKRTAHITGNKQKGLILLDVLMKSATVSIIYYPGCYKGKDSVGNNQTDQMAPEVALQEPVLIIGLQETPTGKGMGLRNGLLIICIRKKIK